MLLIVVPPVRKQISMRARLGKLERRSGLRRSSRHFPNRQMGKEERPKKRAAQLDTLASAEWSDTRVYLGVPRATAASENPRTEASKSELHPHRSRLFTPHHRQKSRAGIAGTSHSVLHSWTTQDRTRIVTDAPSMPYLEGERPFHDLYSMATDPHVLYTVTILTGAHENVAGTFDLHSL